MRHVPMHTHTLEPTLARTAPNPATAPKGMPALKPLEGERPKKGGQ